MGSYVRITYRCAGKHGAEEDNADYEGKLVDKRIGGEDRESFITLKDCLVFDLSGNFVEKVKSKKLIDAYVQTCEYAEKRDKTPQREVQAPGVPGAPQSFFPFGEGQGGAQAKAGPAEDDDDSDDEPAAGMMPGMMSGMMGGMPMGGCMNMPMMMMPMMPMGMPMGGMMPGMMMPGMMSGPCNMQGCSPMQGMQPGPNTMQGMGCGNAMPMQGNAPMPGPMGAMQGNAPMGGMPLSMQNTPLPPPGAPPGVPGPPGPPSTPGPAGAPSPPPPPAGPSEPKDQPSGTTASSGVERERSRSRG